MVLGYYSSGYNQHYMYMTTNLSRKPYNYSNPVGIAINNVTWQLKSDIFRLLLTIILLYLLFILRRQFAHTVNIFSLATAFKVLKVILLTIWSNCLIPISATAALRKESHAASSWRGPLAPTRFAVAARTILPSQTTGSNWHNDNSVSVCVDKRWNSNSVVPKPCSFPDSSARILAEKLNWPGNSCVPRPKCPWWFWAQSYLLPTAVLYENKKSTTWCWYICNVYIGTRTTQHTWHFMQIQYSFCLWFFHTKDNKCIYWILQWINNRYLSTFREPFVATYSVLQIKPCTTLLEQYAWLC